MGAISFFSGRRGFFLIKLPAIAARIPARVNLMPAKSICEPVSSAAIENKS